MSDAVEEIVKLTKAMLSADTIVETARAVLALREGVQKTITHATKQAVKAERRKLEHWIECKVTCSTQYDEDGDMKKCDCGLKEALTTPS